MEALEIVRPEVMARSSKRETDNRTSGKIVTIATNAAEVREGSIAAFFAAVRADLDLTPKAVRAVSTERPPEMRAKLTDRMTTEKEVRE